MRSTEPNKKKAVAQLRKDLDNGPLHCFGLHTNCSPDFCKTKLNILVICWAIIPFHDRKSLFAFNTPSQHGITIHQSNHYFNKRAADFRTSN